MEEKSHTGNHYTVMFYVSFSLNIHIKGTGSGNSLGMLPKAVQGPEEWNLKTQRQGFRCSCACMDKEGGQTMWEREKICECKVNLDTWEIFMVYSRLLVC